MPCLEATTLEKLREIVGPANVLTREEELEPYTHDELPGLFALPEAVVKPGSTQEIAAVLRLANEALLPVTPRGLGTGLSGGALAVAGEIGRAHV